jgi:cell volume regulation protein A
MIGMLELARHHDASFAIVLREFSLEMGIGLAIGLIGAVLLLPLLQRPLPNEGLYPLRTLAAAGAIYGVAAVAHGSGFLAVFIAGLVVGDARAPYKEEIERFHNSLANLAEIVVFVALGLTIDLTDLGAHHRWLDGLLLALILALLARPLAARARPAARADDAPARRRAVRDVGRAQGRRPDPARSTRACCRR